MRRPLLCLLLILLVLGTARPAQAEEIFVLDNGEVLRGWVVREEGESIRVRLAGFVGDARVSIPRHRVLRRFVSTERREKPQPTSSDWAANARNVELVEDLRPEPEHAFRIDLPEEEPAAGAEGFFQRLARVVVLAVPRHPAGRVLMGGLLFAALLVLVALGGRVAEVEGLGLGRATVLALLLGAILAVNVFFHDDLLRADRATWVLPLQGAVWLGAAMALLRVGVARTVLLFAFVLFSVSVVVFSAGAILVSY